MARIETLTSALGDLITNMIYESTVGVLQGSSFLYFVYIISIFIIFTGAIFASMASIETLTSAVGDVITNMIYEKTVGFFKGFFFLVFVLYNSISLLLMM